MKSIILTAAITVLSISLNAQDKYFTRDGHIKFFSETPVENIEADNHKVTAILDEATGKIEFSALMKSFEFEKALMEEHFNENYVESNKYPKATFKGEVQNFNAADYAVPGKEVTVKGVLEMHGVSREIEETGTLTKKDGSYHIDCKFMVNPEDYNIEIPNTVRDNIAKEIEVTIDVTLKIFKK